MQEITRFDEIRAEVAARLRPICAAMPDADFQVMVASIARIQQTYETRQDARTRGGPAREGLGR